MPADILALRSARPVFGVAEAERMARDLYGLAVAPEPLSGERDCNFHLRTADSRQYVLKILDGSADAQAADCLVRVLRHLAEQDASLPIPRLYPTQRGEDLGRVERDGVSHATCLIGHLPGRLLAEVVPDERLLARVGLTLARLDRALRGFFHPSLAQRIAWDVRRLPELREHVAHVDAQTRSGVESALAAMTLRLPVLRGLRAQAIHGDCHAGNVLIDAEAADVSGVLDFGDMIHAPLILEIAVALSELLTHGSTTIQGLAQVLEGYASREPLRASEIESLYDLIVARHAVTIVIHAWRRRHDPGGAQLLDRVAGHAAWSLEQLQAAGRRQLTDQWHAAAGTSPDTAGLVDLGRRHRLMGKGAELFYDRPLQLVRGEGVWLEDRDGRRYLDAYNNVPHVGHCHPAVVRAIQAQVARLATHTRYLHESILEYAEALTSRCPAHLDACLFVNSGSEANDVAWRMAGVATGGEGAVVMAHAYHGITDAAARLTPRTGHPHDPRVAALAPPPGAWAAGDTPDAAQLAAIDDDAARAVSALRSRGLAPAAFFLDSALTSSGIFDPPPAWLATVASTLRAAGALLVADEVQYGLGRSGSHFWGFERRGRVDSGSAPGRVGEAVVPDIVTLGKPIGNGYPLGVVIASRALIEAFQARYGFFSTFGGNPVAAAAGLAVLRVIDREQLVANAHATGVYLRRRLEAAAARHRCLGQVRGAGLLMGLDVHGRDLAASQARTRRIVNGLAARHRILIGSEGPSATVLKLRPPLPFRAEHADLLVAAIAAEAAAIDAEDAG